jgi:hypothetical protein
MTGRNGEVDTDERREDEQSSSGGTYETSVCRKQQRENNTSRHINYKQQLVDILEEKIEHIDEDKTFVLSLVPGFKKLSDLVEADPSVANMLSDTEASCVAIALVVCLKKKKKKKKRRWMEWLNKKEMSTPVKIY